jgi:hypothetical protein
MWRSEWVMTREIKADRTLAMLVAVASAVALPAAAQASVCIDSYRIDHTEVPDDKQILFYMRDHSVYQARMQCECVGLSNDTRGFTYEPIPGSEEICGNLLTIRLNTTHAVCMVGAMKLIKPSGH